MLDMKKALTKLMTQPMLLETGTDGIWKYRKWSDGTYDAWYDGTINLLTGSSWIGGYCHKSSSGLTVPSFSNTVSYLYAQPNGATLAIFCGYERGTLFTYWFNGGAGTFDNLAVSIHIRGTWS